MLIDSRRIGIPIFLSLGILILVNWTGGAWAAQSPPVAASDNFFETKIRPVLANNCYSCHTDSQLGGLRLDSAAAMLKGGKRGAAVVPGDPDNSLVLQAVRHTNPDLKMPMGGAKLKDSEIADLTEWVKAGAVWPAAPANAAVDAKPNTLGNYVIPPERRNFWSFVPLKNPPVPQPKDAKWAKTYIDRFVLFRLEQEGLKPVRPASKHDLLRRATLDLIGLPPTTAEYADFEKDNSPDAFAKVIDRLLASPHYGERWGRVWLDVARFGEDDVQSLIAGGHYRYPNAYLYRDWVVQAMNDDMPYGEFVKAQLAGDLLDPNTRPKTLPATGFLGLGPWLFNTSVAEIARPAERNERVDAVSRGFLGLTVACARCHNHKYDPIPTTDYYALAGVFANTFYKDYPLVPQAVVERNLRLREVVDRKGNELRDYQDQLTKENVGRFVSETANYLQGVWEATDNRKKKDIAEVVESRKLDYEVLQRWISYMSKPTKWYRQKDAWQAMMKEGGDERQAKKLAEEFQANVERVMYAKKDLDAENVIIQHKALEGTAPIRRSGKPSDYQKTDLFGGGLQIEYKQLPEQDVNFWMEIFQNEIPEEGYDPYLVGIGVLRTKPGPLSFTGWALESRAGAERWAKLSAMRKELADLRKELEPNPVKAEGTYARQFMPAYPYIDGVEDGEKITDLEVYIGGSAYNLGPKVPRHFLTVLSDGDPKPFTKGSGRLELAEAIVKQPIAMRVIVNRIWKEHFGTGIVETPSNFGNTGERPLHPELLEYLASEFVRNGMSIKKLHRQIMLSAVYQLSTEPNDAALAKDPANRLYWRANQRRMTAEQLRDSILAVAGTLDDSIGGPSVELTTTFTRRTIYGTVSRFKLDPYLQSFDFPSPSASAEKRFPTTVPLQRLFLMNSDFVQLRAEEVGKATEDQRDERGRIRKIYSLIYGREATERELSRGADFIRSEARLSLDEQGSSAAAQDTSKLTARAGGTGPSDVQYEPTVWGRYIKVLLGSSEFVYIN
jgi:mono/diheme cytochrome c family protein